MFTSSGVDSLYSHVPQLIKIKTTINVFTSALILILKLKNKSEKACVTFVVVETFKWRAFVSALSHGYKSIKSD